MRHFWGIVISLLCCQPANARTALAQPERLHELAQQKYLNAAELAELQASITEIRAKAPQGARDVCDSLLAIVQLGQDNIVAPFIVPLACEKADAKAADDIVNFIGRLVADVHARPPSDKDRLTMRSATILGAFFRDGALAVAAKTTHPQVLLDAVINAATASPPMLPPDARQQSLLVITNTLIPQAMRKEYAIKFVSLSRNEPAPDGFAELFAREDFPKLRQLVRDSNTTAETFSYGAADILAHHGDETVLSDLRSFLARHAAGKPTPEGMIQWNIWQIENQHPPTKLLDYIRGTDMRAGEQGRMWAVRRAVERGLAKADIREAILKHASLVQPDTRTGIRRGLSSLKMLCLELKVLEPSDLPSVAVARPGPTP